MTTLRRSSWLSNHKYGTTSAASSSAAYLSNGYSWHGKRWPRQPVWMNCSAATQRCQALWLVTFVARITISKSHQPRSFQRCRHLEIPPPAGNLAFSTLTNRRLTGICSGPGAIRKARKSGFRALETRFFLAKTPVSLSWGGRYSAA